MAELLLELLSEEIPARMQTAAAERLREELVELAHACGFVREIDVGDVKTFVTPRRLVGVVRKLPAQQPDSRDSRKGPRVGAPAAAVEAFARSLDLSPADLAVEALAKGEFHVAHWTRKGRPTAAVLAEKLPDLVYGFSWPKSMRWGEELMPWVRPLRRALCLFNGKPIPLVITRAVPCGATTVGHRVHAPASFAVTGFADYKKKLRKARVIVDWAERRARIEKRANQLAAKEGLEIKPDPALLDELAGLVEWPEVQIGAVDTDFMTLPTEVLTTAMRHHQKYLSLQTPEGALAPRFVMVADLKPTDRGRRVVAGNERVLRARLADAKFFWDQDRKRSLESRVPALSGMVYHARLGTEKDKTERVRQLAKQIARYIPGADFAMVERAAGLSKADLTTEMVSEFPELQGVMGRYYALNDGEERQVADALADYYPPHGPNDRCPTQPVGVAISLASKIDTLVGFFTIGEGPTGSKDRYALRRAALGVIRLILENGLRLSLVEQFRFSRALFPPIEGAINPSPAIASLLDFFADRLKVHFRDHGLRHDLISAVFALREDDLVRLVRRATALRGFLETEDGENLLTAHRRLNNIVRIEEKKDGRMYEGADMRDERLVEPAEKNLLEHHKRVRELVLDANDHERFEDACKAFATLRAPVDAFFEQVRVNVDDQQLRENRLRLLDLVRTWFLYVADFSQIEG